VKSVLSVTKRVFKKLCLRLCTGTDGLRIRSAPGLNTETVFRGEESEAFLVKDGPQTVDGYTWWYVVAPYDDTRAGWAAAEFLAVVPPPQE